MTVIVLTAVPPALRGVLTRWLFEIAPGVFVGRVSARVRELLWERIVDGVGRGRAILVHRARNEQGLAFRVHGHDWSPVDFDGLALMMRPAGPEFNRARRAESANGAGIGAAETIEHSGRGSASMGADFGGGPARNWSHAGRRLRGR